MRASLPGKCLFGFLPLLKNDLPLSIPSSSLLYHYHWYFWEFFTLSLLPGDHSLEFGWFPLRSMIFLSILASLKNTAVGKVLNLHLNFNPTPIFLKLLGTVPSSFNVVSSPCVQHSSELQCFWFVFFSLHI